MSNNTSPNRIARLPGNSGARPPTGNQVGIEKSATGTSSITTLRNDHDNDRPQRHRHWPRFLLINGEDPVLGTLSSITISKTLTTLIGPVEQIRRLRSGSLLIHCSQQMQSDTLLQMKTLSKAPVQVIPHGTLNTCKGVIISSESTLCTDKDLQEWLSQYDVVDIKRFEPRKDRTQLLILTFNGKSIPQRVSVGFEGCRVRPYIPNPQRCFNCQRFGHMSRACSRQATCSNCGSLDHLHSREVPCSVTPYCVNCGGGHSSFDKSCPQWQTEKEVLKLKVTKEISFPEARRLAALTPGLVTYAAVAKLPSNQKPSSPHLYGGPRSSPRASQRTRVQLSPGKSFSKYSNLPSKQSINSASNDLFERLDYIRDSVGLTPITAAGALGPRPPTSRSPGALSPRHTSKSAHQSPDVTESPPSPSDLSCTGSDEGSDTQDPMDLEVSGTSTTSTTSEWKKVTPGTKRPGPVGGGSSVPPSLRHRPSASPPGRLTLNSRSALNRSYTFKLPPSTSKKKPPSSHD